MGTQSLLTLFQNPSAGDSYGNHDFLKLAALPLEHFHTSILADAIEIIQKEKPQFLLVDTPNIALLEFFHQNTAAGTVILLTDLPMEHYSRILQGHEAKLVQHVISIESVDSYALSELRVCLQKELEHDIFGVAKYLNHGTKIENYQIHSSHDRLPINQSLQKSLDQMGLSSYYSRLAVGIAEELMMNAIYDAPLASGKEKYRRLNRQHEVLLDKCDEAVFSVACDGRILALSVIDPFGELSRDKVFQYLRKVLVRNDTDQLIDTKELGAGLGLYKVLYSCHSLVFNVQKGKFTEVLALIDCERQLRDFSRMPRSIQYFEID